MGLGASLTVREVSTSHTVGIGPAESLAAAARLMTSRHVGALVVVEGEDLCGIITERDLTRAIAEGVDPETARVGVHMTGAPALADLDEDARSVVARMLDLGVRHMPVVSHGRVVGIVSSRDLLHYLARALA